MSKIQNLIIELKDLTKKYGQKLIFSNINMKIYEGDRIALVGRNGSGKTTLIEMICGLRSISSGKIIYANQRKFFQDLGVQFQQGKYPHSLRVKDLIWLYLNVYNKKMNWTIWRDFKIEEIQHQYLNSLSMGQQKRLEIFLIIATGVKFLILDEVCSGMDIEIRFWLINYLKKYLQKNKITLIYISHDIEEVYSLCERLVMLSKKGLLTNDKITSRELLIQKLEKKIQVQISENETK